MRLTIVISHRNPFRTEQVEMEDVERYELTDDGLLVVFNTSPTETVPFRSNDGHSEIDWMNATIIATRVGLQVDMTQ